MAFTFASPVTVYEVFMLNVGAVVFEAPPAFAAISHSFIAQVELTNIWLRPEYNVILRFS